MAFLVTLGELVTTCQQLANKEGDDDEQIGVPEWKAHISAHYGRLHTTVADTGARYFETEATINLASLALPSDHKATIGVDLVLDSAGRRRQLPELMIQERGCFAGLAGGEAQAWSFSAGNLQLYPATPTSGTYKHLYIPQPTRYNTAADATSIDVISTDGLEAITWGVAAVGLHRGESQQQRALDEAAAALGRVREWAVKRSLSEPKRQVIRSLGNSSSIHGAWNPASWRYR